MFGGPCDLAGLQDFYAAYPEIQWELASRYRVLDEAADPRTVTFSYTRTWRGPAGERLAVDAEESISFNGAGKVARIAYTKPPTEPRAVGVAPAS